MFHPSFQVDPNSFLLGLSFGVVLALLFVVVVIVVLSLVRDR